MNGIHWFSQPLKKSVNRAQTQNYKQHVPHADMYECKNEWMWMNKWMNKWMNEWITERLDEWIDEWMNEWLNQSTNTRRHEKQERTQYLITCGWAGLVIRD